MENIKPSNVLIDLTAVNDLASSHISMYYHPFTVYSIRIDDSVVWKVSIRCVPKFWDGERDAASWVVIALCQPGTSWCDWYARLWRPSSSLTTLLLGSLHIYKTWSLHFGSCWSVPSESLHAAWSVNTPYGVGYQGIDSMIPINTAQAVSCQQASTMAVVATLSSSLLLLPDTYPSHSVFIELFSVDTAFLDAWSV